MQGLTRAEVEARIRKGQRNVMAEHGTPTIGRIIMRNTLTLFNGLNIALAALVLAFGHPKNALFMGVVISNTFISIIQEVRAKRAIDRLSVLTQPKARVIREGIPTEIPLEDVVLDDILELSPGAQVICDALVIDGRAEINESLLTGESDAVIKENGAEVLSGSFVVSGRALCRASRVGSDAYANRLVRDAGHKKNPDSPLVASLRKLIAGLAVAIVPIFAVLLWVKLGRDGLPVTEAVTGTVAAIIGMIPEGLMLLSGIALAAGVVALARRDTLVQSLPCVEMLARADVLCLDKTGTITDGHLSVLSVEPVEPNTTRTIDTAVSAILSATGDDNATAKALRAYAGSAEYTPTAGDTVLPFSSARKYAQFGGLKMGAPDVLLGETMGGCGERIGGWMDAGERVIAVVNEGELLGFVRLADNVRKDAQETFAYFREQGVEVKVISGDHAGTVAAVAARAGIRETQKTVDMSKIGEGADYAEIAETHTVFGRVTPEQKRKLVEGMKARGHTVAMTGDGVNDILALSRADCSIAMMSGSDAARSVSDLVLLKDNFAALVQAVYEGRRVVGNLSRVASLYLIKTVYSAILAVVYVFLPFVYPFEPVQLTLVSALCVGIPTFFLALRPNRERIRGDFLKTVLMNAVPFAGAVVGLVLTAQVLAPPEAVSAWATLLTGVVGLAALARAARPYNVWVWVLLAAMALAFAGAFVVMPELFGLMSLT